MKRLFTMALAALPALAMAQVGLELNLNRQNIQLFNAASAGLDDKLNTGLFCKSYWPGLSGNRLSTGAYGSYRIKKIATGVGMHYTYNSINDFTDEHRIVSSVAKHLKAGAGTISLGADATFANYKVNYSKLTFSNFQDSSDLREGSTVDLGAGLIYQTDKLEAGASVRNIFETGPFAYGTPRELFAHAMYHFRLGDDLKLSPMAIYSYVNGFTRAQLNLTATMYERVWVMAGYKRRNALVGGAGVDFGNGIRLGYAYDRTVARLASSTAGNHEILLGFRIPDKPIE